MSYLDQFWDPQANYPDGWSVASVAADEVVRLGRLAQVAEVAATLKRRLDGASPGLLAQDKKWGRRIAHLARQQAGAWLTELGTQGELERVEPGKSLEWQQIMQLAAQVSWPRFVDEQEEELRDKCRLVVSWAVENGARRFANRAANRYMVEIDRMAYVVREGKR